MQTVNELNGATLRRSPTLEAQREPSIAKPALKIWMEAIFAIDEVPDDTVEQKLKETIPKSAADVRRHLRGLLSAYSRLKNNSGHGIGHELFQCFTITNDSRDGLIKSKIDIFQVDKFATFSKFTQALSRCLGLGCPGGLRVVVLCVEPMVKGKKDFLSFSQKVNATFGRSLRSLPLVPNNIIAFLLEHYLKDQLPTLVAPTKPHIHDHRRRLLRPPSISTTRGNLDPNQLTDNQIELAWQAEAPVYTTDVDVYIWEQHKSLPKSQRAVLKLYPGTNTCETALLVLFQTSKSLTSFSNLRGESQLRGLSSTTTSTWSTTSEVLLSICALYRLIILETTSFLQGCSVELENLHLAVRRKPTAAKVNYLVHLEDCRSSAYEGMIHALQVLDSVAKWTDTRNSPRSLWDAGEPFADRFAILQRDLEFLRDNFSHIEKQVKELQETLHDHLELTHNRRNFILAIGAAIYLPLSFATSFFGMNINTTTPAGPQGFSNWTTSWITNSPVDTQNSTKALVSSIGSSGTLSYPWKTFIITAICLVITLPLSLGMGNILRVVYRKTIHFAIYWRLLAVVPGMTFIFFSIYGGWLQEFGVLKILWGVCNILLIVFFTIKLFLTIMEEKIQQVWTVMAIATGIFFLLDLHIPHVPMMIMPWLLFLFIWLRSWYRSR